MSTNGPVLVLHDTGDPDGGERWRAAFDATSWAGPVIARDLPGHGMQPAPIDGTYEIADAALVALRLLREHGGDDAPVVVGVGANGWSALMLALGGRAGALVLADALTGPWLSPTEWAMEHARWLRGIVDDPAALAPAPTDYPVLDPRLRHGVLPIATKHVVDDALEQLTVPWCRVDSRDPDAVAVHVTQWAAQQKLFAAI